jgi:protein TonB
MPPVDTPPPQDIPPPSTMPAMPQPPQPQKVAKVEHHAPPAAPPPPMVSGPVHAGPSDYLVAPMPEYPFAAKQHREQGRVMILALVDGAGYVTDASVHQSSGYSILDESARRAVREEYRFTPGNQRQLLVPIDFRLP